MAQSDAVPVMQNVAKLIAAAEACAEKRDWQRADTLFREALNLDESPRSRISYGICLAEQERYFEAISVITPVLDVTDTSAISIVCHNLASIYREVGDFDLSRRFQWRATLMQDDSESTDLLGLANDALMGDNPELAASLIMSASEMDGDGGNDSEDGDLIATAALVKDGLGSTEDGVVTLFAAYRRHQVAGDLRGMGADQLNMAMLFADLKRYRAERSCLLRAIRYFEQAPAPFSRMRALQHLDVLNRMESVRRFDAQRN